MKSRLYAAAAALALFGAAGAAQAADVEIKDAVARVVIIPEDRSDVAVEIVPGTATQLPKITMQRTGSGKVILDGNLGRNRIRGCDGKVVAGSQPLDGLAGVKVRIRGADDVSMAQSPIITIRTPKDLDVSAKGAVFGWVGRSDRAEVGNAGCGDWTIGDVKGSLEIAQAGSGDTRAGSSASLSISIAGSGDVAAGPTGDLEASIAGSGDVRVASVNGRVEAAIAGSGDVRVDGGRATSVEASIAGSGDVRVDAPATSAEANIMGSGDVYIQSVSGTTSKSVMGSGTLRVGG
ncbi:MAG TPA: DUF2807 domain-containing protein [Caulobacteraceae bacterium]|nr:DUF2807 domain-containing protein [Caulobacteraceae bacterium]